MYNLLLIDNDLREIFDDKILKEFDSCNINYKFINTEPDKPLQNTIFLSNNKDKICGNYCHNVYLSKDDFDFLNIKNATCILNKYDVIKIYNKDIFVDWAVELQFLAQNTLTFSKNDFDVERAKRLREISCEMLSFKYNIPIESIKEVFANEVGYKTPKIENRAAVIKDNKILLVREKVDNKWSMPGGYQDVNKTIKENIIKECIEEAGAIVKPIKPIALLNYNKHHGYCFPLGMLKVIVLCDYVSHSFVDNNETMEAKFFEFNKLPELSGNRTTLKQIKMAFECYYNKESWEVVFD